MTMRSLELAGLALLLTLPAGATTREELSPNAAPHAPAPIATDDAPISPAPAKPDWTGITFRANNQTERFIFRWSDVHPVTDGFYTAEMPLYAAAANGAAVSATPTEYAIRFNPKNGVAKVVKKGSSTALASLGDLGGATVSVASLLSLPAGAAPQVTVAGAPAAAPAPGGFSSYEQVARDSLLPQGEDQAKCNKDVAACRKTLAQAMDNYMKAHADMSKPLDQLELGYVKARLGDTEFTKLKDTIEKNPAAVRERIFAEMKGYVNPAAANKAAYDPNQTDAGLGGLLEKKPKTPSATDLKMATPLGVAIYNKFNELYPASASPYDNAQNMKEAKLLYAYLEGKPEGQKLLDALTAAEKDPKDPAKKKAADDLLTQYRNQARDAAKRQILTPAAASPFGNNDQKDLLDGYCEDLYDLKTPAAPASAGPCAALPPDKQFLKGVASAACTTDGRQSFDGAAPQPNQSDQQKINAMCQPWKDKHAEQRRHMQTGAPTLPDGLGVSPAGTTGPPNPLGNCEGGPDKCASPKKPGVNDKIPWETGVVWGAVAMIALGILTGGVGLAVVAGAAAAGMVGWYVGKEANR